MQSLKQCTWILTQSYKDDESMMEMSGRALAKLIRLLCQCKMSKRVSLSRPWGLNREPPRIESLAPLFTKKSGRPDAPVRSTRRRTPAFGRVMHAMWPLLQILIARSQWSSVHLSCGRTLYNVRPDKGPHRPVTSSKVPVATEHVRSRPTGLAQRPITYPLLYASQH